MRPTPARLLAALLLATPASWAQSQLVFTEVSATAGVAYEHGYDELDHLTKNVAGGVASGDYDRDGFVDLYVVRGDVGPNLLFRNRGDGTFEEVAVAAGVSIGGVEGDQSVGPSFGDLDGDGWLDLVVGGLPGTQPRLFLNDRSGAFVEITGTAGVTATNATFSTTFGDYDRDGDVDMVMSHWSPANEPCQTPCGEHVWRNNGDGTFTEADVEVGLTGYELVDYSFAPILSDITGDGWPDLLMADDFRESKIFHNRGDGTFEDATGAEIIVNNAMGSTTGDYDNDGDQDWFVTAIYNPNNGKIGNDLYENLGNGGFVRVTDAAGVGDGEFGWAACFADFDNDGFLDIFHVNGWFTQGFINDPSRFFRSNGDGTFDEIAQQIGITDEEQGRGVVCFDHDRDGDLDIFVANNSGVSKLYRNDGKALGAFLAISLRGPAPNVLGLGALVTVTAGGSRQVREIRGGNNFVSQDPAEAHFGLGGLSLVDEIEVRWPDGAVDTYGPQAVNQFLELAPQERAVDSIGVYAPDLFALRYSNTEGPADETFAFGPTSGPLHAVSGDWDGDGVDQVGVFNENQSRFRLRQADGSELAVDFANPGEPDWLPVVGDWNGDGVDTVGVFNTVTFQFLLRNSNTPGDPDLSFSVGLTGTDWVPVAGDWDGDGVDTVGVYRYRRFQLKNENAPGNVDLTVKMTSAGPGSEPVVGDWDGDGVDEVGTYDDNSGEFQLKYENASGDADLIFLFGDPEQHPIAGDWN